MQRIIFESAPEYVILCLAVGLVYATIQYWRTKHPWGNTLNWVLFGLRGALAFFLALLLMGPIVKQVSNLFERPLFVILHDNSGSVKEASDSVSLQTLEQSLMALKESLQQRGYEAMMHDLTGNDIRDFQYNSTTSDLHGALRRITTRYEGRNIGGVILASDGIYNSGLSPLYASYNFPIYTLGIGDTTQRPDVALKNVAYNKIAYQGNKFPLRAEVQVKNLSAKDITVSLFKRGKLIEKQTKATSRDQLLSFDFQPSAEEQGIQKIDVEVEVKAGEYNKRNNRSSVFVEVVEGKKKILLVAPAPHPDIKALREVVDKNSNYEFLLHIPGIQEQQAADMRPDQVDLAIFHQSPDTRGKTSVLFQSFLNTKTSLLIIVGQQSDLAYLSRQNIAIRFEGLPRDYDEVTPLINPAFSSFILSTETNSIAADYPPVTVPFGKLQVPLSATPLLFQRVGSVSTEKPLLSVDTRDLRKIGVMLGEGLWRWRLNEFDRTENTVAFDEVFGKLIQFLSTTDDKRKFRSYPVQQEFSDSDPVIFESQVYNEIFEPVYGNTVEIDVTNENGKKNQYDYVISPGNTTYQIGGLSEGVYRYKARTVVNQKTEEVRGEFAVVERKTELQNLTADFDLLRKISSNTGGRFFTASSIEGLNAELQRTDAKSIIHSEETYDSLINLKWVFWLLLLWISAEWFLRKFHGSY
ncbi:MAG: VWA domain-containing protein [Bacteroidota bacterium]